MAATERPGPGRGAVDLSHLQRTVGNGGVSRLLGPPNVVQRTILDQNEPLTTWRAYTPGQRPATGTGSNPEIVHVDELLGRFRPGRARDAREVDGRDVAVRLKVVLDAWHERAEALPAFVPCAAAVAALRNDVDLELTKPADDWISTRYGGPRSERGDRRVGIAAGSFEDHVARGGMAVDVKGTFLADYRLVRALLLDDRAIDAHLRQIEGKLESDPGTTLLKVIQQYEDLVGFPTKEVVPLGLLSPERFLNLVARGHPFDDFGAGLKHGGLTHRLQWFVIASEVTDRFASPAGPFANGFVNGPLALYRYLGSPDLRDLAGPGAKSLWGSLLDDGGSMGPVGNQPDRLHGRLLGVSHLRRAGPDAGNWATVEDEVLTPRRWTTLQSYFTRSTDLQRFQRELQRLVREYAEFEMSSSPPTEGYRRRLLADGFTPDAEITPEEAGRSDILSRRR